MKNVSSGARITPIVSRLFGLQSKHKCEISLFMLKMYDKVYFYRYNVTSIDPKSYITQGWNFVVKLRVHFRKQELVSVVPILGPKN